jgi:hypothetical protein
MHGKQLNFPEKPPTAPGFRPIKFALLSLQRCAGTPGTDPLAHPRSGFPTATAHAGKPRRICCKPSAR